MTIPAWISRSAQQGHYVPSGQRIPVPSNSPRRSLGPPLGVKSTKMALAPSILPVSVHLVPDPSAGHPGLPSVPCRDALRPSTEMMRWQLGWNGSKEICRLFVRILGVDRSATGYLDQFTIACLHHRRVEDDNSFGTALPNTYLRMIRTCRRRLQPWVVPLPEW